MLSAGSQGSGQMSIRLNRELQCSGFESADGTFTIRYTFGNGTQSGIMPQPGQPYTGTTRDACVPCDYLLVCFSRFSPSTLGRDSTLFDSSSRDAPHRFRADAVYTLP